MWFTIGAAVLGKHVRGKLYVLLVRQGALRLVERHGHHSRTRGQTGTHLVVAVIDT